MPIFAHKVEEFVAELDGAVQSHLDWTRRVLRCAVLHTPPGDDVLAPDAHCHCRFGQWIGKYHERFDQIDAAATARMFSMHQLMHAAARTLCSTILADGRGREADLAEFESSQHALFVELANFKTQLLEHSARLDALTGLPLRHGLEDEFERFRATTQRLGMTMVLMMIDIDHFKRINDTYGHAVGDLALKHTAEVLAAQARGDEPIFRFGGEEFLQLVRVAASDEAEILADRMLQALRETPIALPDHGTISVRASAGLVAIEPGEEMTDAIGRADRALYQAKDAGRDRWLWAEESGGTTAYDQMRPANPGVDPSSQPVLIRPAAGPDTPPSQEPHPRETRKHRVA